MPVPESDRKPASAEGRFASTHWSVVLAAARTASPEAQAALEKLCVAYWYPLYAYLRRRGHPPEEAEDLTQEFFASRVVTRRIFQGAEPGAGRFRSWLLTSLQNMVKNEWEKQQTAKRGGALSHLSRFRFRRTGSRPVGLFGMSVLAGTPLDDLRTKLRPTASGSSCGSGCGGSSCGGCGSCGSCGGGGGCGGCGGGD